MTEIHREEAVPAWPFHEGEQILQHRMGARGVEDWAGKAIRSYMPDQHRRFFAGLPFLVVSARDAAGRPWATLLEGEDGFVSSPEDTLLDIRSGPVSGDALEGAFTGNADIGILGIELATRRRNRANGRVRSARAGAFTVAIDQSFGNCPQYIRERTWWRGPAEPVAAVARTRELTVAQMSWIGRADTFFIASGFRGAGVNPAYGMDVSHRGGERGFVDVADDRTIRFPDYAGNRFYNTLGNVAIDPRAGLLFVDFSTGSLLQLTGRAGISRSPEELRQFAGAQQIVTFEIGEVVELASALRLRWQQDAASVRSLRLVEKTRETADVTSFVFEARDHGPLPAFRAGQHLPVELNIAGRGGKVQRTYSLSGAPADPRYRISVKREPGGLASAFLHDGLDIGAIVESRTPAGDFVLPDGPEPLVLVSAGIGITPMLSILHAVAREDVPRPVWFVHGARDGAHLPFRREVAGLVGGRDNMRMHIFLSRPLDEDVPGRDFDTRGHISGGFLTALAGRRDARYLLCGPAAFLAKVKAELEAEGVPDSRIRYETF
ncbi:pyridoxamine 5'-phosphate oxidase family protein [Labrenzia sp. 011]|uniref:pyridoxamine 5'-phosphate oxidase family protein n=1 Tax=Labrenzia sp. 011 TaxID=2171494 RepID=UPI000D506501|nr:pyridoxamine 5'-phosphate oxidase family protein [Labrenzia sp. 011]PVB61018.1 ferredoxin [Labrenzia sp. 011]